jgi:hypothetical protein
MLVIFGLIVFLNMPSETQNLASPSPTMSPTSQPTSTSTINLVDYDAEAQRLFNLAVTEIEEIRNVTIPQVSLQVVTKDWAIQTWGVSSAQSDVKNLQMQENIYKALLMISQNASLYQATVDWAGYFMAVTQAGKIYIVKENFNITNTVDAEATMAHELTHIMQNIYNIPQYYFSYDASKARTALTEGDATFTASYIKNQTLTTNMPSPDPNYTIQKDLVTNNPNDVTVFPSIPDSVYNLDYFPYKYGEKFMQALYGQGGWEMVNQAYRNPPNSTEQIMHPEKYFDAELPESVAETKPSEGNWTKKWGAQYGEFFIQNMLHTNLTQYETEKASTGWGGDRLVYYENPDNQYLITWNIKWDTYVDSAEFLVCFNDYMKSAGAQETQSYQWQTNQIYQKIIWAQNTNSTLIIASTDQNALEQFR